MPTIRKLTRRELMMGTLMVGIISTGAIGGALLRDEQQTKEAKSTFASLPYSEQLERLESAREGLFKRQMVIERKLEISRDRREMKDKARDINTQVQAQVREATNRDPMTPSPTAAEDANGEKLNIEGSKGWKGWLGFS